MCDKACGEDTLYERSVSSISVSKGSESRVRALTESGKDGHCCLVIVGESINNGRNCHVKCRHVQRTARTMNSVSHQISQYLAQPDLDSSRKKALNYLNDNHPFSQPTSSLEDALQRIRHERDTVRISVRNNRHPSG